MTTPNYVDSQDGKLDEVLAIIDLLARKSAGDDYIYRGEPEWYPKVSSSLYRKLIEQFQQFPETRDVSEIPVAVIQDWILNEAEKFMAHNPQTGRPEILAQLQHYGGETNLIDFTTDYLTALFFACDGESGKDGRVIIFSRPGEMDNRIVSASSPTNRVIAQKSVFVIPAQGFIEPSDTVNIPHDLKRPMLDFLRTRHGIYTETIYNDLYGFIRVQNLHQQTYAMLYVGLVCHQNNEFGSAIRYYTNALDLNPRMGIALYNRGIAHYDSENFELAIKDFNDALDLDPGDVDIYLNRGLVWLCLSEWENAELDLVAAEDMEADVKAYFSEVYGDIETFQRRYRVELPGRIKLMLV